MVTLSLCLAILTGNTFMPSNPTYAVGLGPTSCKGLYNAVFTSMNVTVVNPGGSPAGVYDVLSAGDAPTHRIGVLVAIPYGGAAFLSHTILTSRFQNGTQTQTGPGSYWLSIENEDGQVSSNCTSASGANESISGLVPYNVTIGYGGDNGPGTGYMIVWTLYNDCPGFSSDCFSVPEASSVSYFSVYWCASTQHPCVYPDSNLGGVATTTTGSAPEFPFSLLFVTTVIALATVAAAFRFLIPEFKKNGQL
jgi:hypothetical protein